VLVLFGMKDKTEARGVKFRHEVRLSSAQRLNKTTKAPTSKVTSSAEVNKTHKVLPLQPKLDACPGRPKLCL